MRITLPFITALCTAALAAPACGGGSGNTGGSGGATSSSTSAAGGDTAGTSSSSGSGGALPMNGPFTSKGSSSYETQTSIAADGKGNLVAVWIAFQADSSSSVGYAVSHDGGDTWTPPQYVASPGGRLVANPVVAADGQSRFHLAWLGFRVDFTNPDEHVYLSRLDAGTETFPAPVVASDDGASATRDFDKPAIAVDADPSVSHWLTM